MLMCSWINQAEAVDRRFRAMAVTIEKLEDAKGIAVISFNKEPVNSALGKKSWTFSMTAHLVGSKL